jgi:hypothetical protein
MMDINKLEEAQNIAKHLKHKRDVYRRLERSHTGNHINLIAKRADHTGIMQASIDRPRDLEFSLPKDAILEALARQILVLEDDLRRLGVTGFGESSDFCGDSGIE